MISLHLRSLQFFPCITRTQQVINEFCSKRGQAHTTSVPNWVPFREPGSPRGPFCGFGSPFLSQGPIFSILACDESVH